MRLIALLSSAVLLAACGDSPTSPVPVGHGLRVVNAFTSSVDVLIDGSVAASGLSAGAIDTVDLPVGSHTVSLRPAGSTASFAPQSMTGTAYTLNTLAVLRSSTGAVSSTVLDDTNSVVPSGATKVRVLHFAPNAGEIVVMRTQPDYQTPIQWQFPFTYQANPDPLSAPFFQSTVGSWELRIWIKASSETWSTATTRVVVPLGSGEKRTVIVLDKAGGGIRVELL
jgi:hypothetical protein